MPRLAKIKVSVLVASWEEGGFHYASCPFLNVITHGSSKARAHDNLIEEIEFLFASTLKEDSLVEMLDFRTANPREPDSPDASIPMEFTNADFELPSGIPVEILKRISDATELSV